MLKKTLERVTIENTSFASNCRGLRDFHLGYCAVTAANLLNVLQLTSHSLDTLKLYQVSTLPPAPQDSPHSPFQDITLVNLSGAKFALYEELDVYRLSATYRLLMCIRAPKLI